MNDNDKDIPGLLDQLQALKKELDGAKSEKSAGQLSNRLSDTSRCVKDFPVHHP